MKKNNKSIMSVVRVGKCLRVFQILRWSFDFYTSMTSFDRNRTIYLNIVSFDYLSLTLQKKSRKKNINENTGQHASNLLCAEFRNNIQLNNISGLRFCFWVSFMCNVFHSVLSCVRFFSSLQWNQEEEIVVEQTRKCSMCPSKRYLQ